MSSNKPANEGLSGLFKFFDPAIREGDNMDVDCTQDNRDIDCNKNPRSKAQADKENAKNLKHIGGNVIDPHRIDFDNIRGQKDDVLVKFFKNNSLVVAYSISGWGKRVYTGGNGISIVLFFFSINDQYQTSKINISMLSVELINMILAPQN